MPVRAEAITLKADEWAESEQMTQSRTLPVGDVFRARLVLTLADGLSYRTIQDRLDTTTPIPFPAGGGRVAGLPEIRDPDQKLLVITSSLEANVLEASAAPAEIRMPPPPRISTAR
jgi:hypothetical protein